MDNNKVNNDNIDIFICTHINYNIPVTNDAYRLISCGGNPIEGAIMDNTGDNISRLNGFYCELTGIYWVWKNWNLKDYVGFCHYRRYFDFMDNIPSINDVDADIIITKPLNLRAPNFNYYDIHHNAKDLSLVIDIAENKFGVYSDEFVESHYMSARNMFITSKELFNEYCEFLFGVLDEYCKIKGIKSMFDVYYQVLNDKDYGDPTKYKYQARFAGFLAERLMNIWIMWKGLKIHTMEIKYV